MIKSIMKKISLVILLLIFYNCSSSKETLINNKSSKNSKELIRFDYSGTLDEEQMNFIKDNYEWKDKIAIINFTQPRSYCHFDNSKSSIQSRGWWINFYSKIDTENCLNIFVGSSENSLIDKNDFLLNNFFKRKKTCFGVMVINDSGQYLQFNGHYSEKQVSQFIEKLKKN